MKNYAKQEFLKKPMRSKFPHAHVYKVNIQNPKMSREEILEMVVSILSLMIIFGFLAIVA